jgi:lysozyme
MIERNFMGLDGFVWWIGVVESRQDPLAIGRVKCRAYGVHSSSLTDIPSDDLPWAIVAQATNSDSSPWLKEGDTVMGMFADGRSCQVPIVMFKLPGFQVVPANGAGFMDQRSSADLQNAPRKPTSLTYKSDGSGINVSNPSTAVTYPLPQELGKPTLSGATRYDIANTVIQARKTNLDKGVVTATGLTWDEPYPSYNPLYPYNKATETESGHLIEFDDTPGNERITFTHRAGGFIDMYPTGTRVDKITKSKYEIVMGDDYVHIMGRVLVTVGEGVYIKALGNVNIEADNDLNVSVGGNMNVAVKKQFNLQAASASWNIKGDSNMVVGGKSFITSTGDLHLDAQGTGFFTSQGQLEFLATGTIDLMGLEINCEIGAQSALQGSAVSLPDPNTGQPNQGLAGLESTPNPWQQNFIYLDAYTGTAAKHAMLLTANGAPPDKNTSNVTCNFDANTKTFLTSDQWTISDAGLQSLQQREGFAKALANGSCVAYPDPVIGPALLTIGYGCTQVVLPYTLTANTVRTKEEAVQDQLSAINNIFLPKIKEYVNVDLTQNMIDALISFVFNVGVPNFSTSTLLKDINAQNWCKAKIDFLAWNKSAGKVISNLVKRRQDEANQFIS